jgi:hypothetical protein
VRTTLEREVSLTGVMTGAGESGRGDLDTGEAPDGRSDVPVDVAMELVMLTAATPIAAETPGATTVEPMERNENGKWSSRSAALATVLAPSDWRSHMASTMRQQAQKPTRRHRTIGHQTNLLEAIAAHEEAQWRGIMRWMHERELKWHTRHEDIKLWWAGITNMVAEVRKGAAPGQEATEEERDKTARMDGGGLEASQHADTTQQGGPEKCQQQRQLQPKPRLQLTLQPKPQHEPKQQSAPTPGRQWETIPPHAQSQREPVGPGPAPMARSSLGVRHMILTKDEGVSLLNQMDQEIALAINRALFHQKSPAHIWIMNAKRNTRSIITAITHPDRRAVMALVYGGIIITTTCTVDIKVIDIEENQSWERLKIHALPLVRYMGKGTQGLQKMWDEIHAENEGVAVPVQVQWLGSAHGIEERSHRGEISASSVVVVVKWSMLA